MCWYTARICAVWMSSFRKVIRDLLCWDDHARQENLSLVDIEPAVNHVLLIVCVGACHQKGDGEVLNLPEKGLGCTLA
jgi:hypothetical protein